MSRSRNSTAKIRYAVVGLGHIAQVAVLPAFRQAGNSELVAIVSGDAEKRKKLGKKYCLADVYSYEQYEQALSLVDAVYIALPNHLHRQYTVQAAKAGVHVVCEKPMAVTVEDCEVMMEAAKRNGVRLMIAYRLHFERGNLEAIKIAHSGKLGELRMFSSEFSQQVVKNNVRVTEPVRDGGGPVYDMGVYCINAARYLFQSEPTEVLAFSANNGEARFRKVDEMTSVVMRFPKERIATFTCSFGATDIGTYSLVGTKGRLFADRAYEYASGLKLQVTIGEKARTVRVPKFDQFAAELVYFSDCILRGKNPEPNGVEGLADVRIVRAIYESVRTGKVVKLPALPGKKRPASQQQIQRPGHGEPKTVKVQAASGD
ncbi:MAG: Gfo/Idh/MocA family oxidoreductase [Acidobacteriaceae bacterium]